MEKRSYDRLASHSFRRGHLFLDRFPSQSPQMVMSWLQGVKTSDPSLFVVLGMGALRALPMLLTFVIKTRYPSCQPQQGSSLSAAWMQNRLHDGSKQMSAFDEPQK